MDIPVVFPPGRARLVTSPNPTASFTFVMTMGMVLVAFWTAWTLTALSLWTVVWLIRDYRAIGARPLVLGPETLLVRLGRRFRARVPLGEIERAEAPGWRDIPPKGAPGYLKLSGPGGPNVLLTFARPIEFRGPGGIRRSVTRVGLRLDAPAELLRRLAEGRGEA